MKEILKKRLVTIGVLGILIVLNVISVSATYKSFSKEFVYGNKYTMVTRADKDSSHEYVKLLVSAMYKDDGSTSSYQRSKAALKGWNGESYVRCTIKSDYPQTVVKGVKAKFKLLNAYKKAGKTVKYYAKGNDPDKDCKISGTMWIDEQE